MMSLQDEIDKKKKELKSKYEIYKKLIDEKEKHTQGIYLRKEMKILKETEIELVKIEEEFNQKTTNLYNFIIYSPENTSLRTFEKEGQIQPLGINGEGLLKLLKVINNYEDKSYIQTIIESLRLFGWFEDITIPSKENIENHVIIKDKYLYREIDQRSANEGFLFILFYITLIVAKETPKAFAIDNIDASLNPKLCTKLMTVICDLAKKYDKQIFLTTHNPAILDGINLNDEEQKLFVVSRNKSGHTRMKNITAKDKPKSSTDEPLKLSEAFLRGYLGGLPKGF
jgi:predicted ATPase